MIQKENVVYTCMTSYLKAKSNGESLKEHTEKTLSIFKILKDLYPDVDKKTGQKDFYEIISVALFFHDFGKASTEFQKVLSNEDNDWKKYRHEILSVPFVNLLNYEENTDKLIKIFILTHHKDVLKHKDKIGLNSYLESDFNPGVSFQEQFSKVIPNYSGLLKLSETYNKLSKSSDKPLPALVFPEKLNIPDKSIWEKVLKDLLNDFGNDSFSEKDWKVLVFGKAFVNTCDHLASGDVEQILKPLNTIEKLFPFTLSEVQTTCSKAVGNTILISPTGSGKTEAALLWATNNITDGSRVFYMLPYSASINAMFQRLFHLFTKEYHGDKDAVTMIHGKSSYYLHKFFEEEGFSDTKGLSRKMYAPYKIVTPFQVIKHLFSIKGWESGLLELYKSVIILDEIHAYDPRTVGLILGMCQFLTGKFDVKILLMSATLPQFIINYFLDEIPFDNKIVMRNEELEIYIRHRCRIINGDIISNLEKIKKDLKTGKKVLVVCNTVKRAQKVYEELKSLEINSVLLHSRFILKDREDKESHLKDVQLLVGTQVIEVSLDIDYDTCFTEPAPIDALIQRFGRVNRKRQKGICDVFVFTEGSESDKYIYDPELVTKTLKELKGVDILQELEIQAITNRVYSDGFGEKKSVFEEAKTNFEHVIDDIKPLSNASRTESMFLQLFDSIEAVPSCYREEYTECIQNKDIFGSMSYLLKISKRQYAQLKSKDLIEYDKDCEISFVYLEYDSETGLNFEKTSVINNID